MLKSISIVLAFLILAGCTTSKNQIPDYWSQASGPNANWTIESADDVPAEFSVRSSENILWTMDLPEVGQGGITIWEDKIFLTVMKPIYEEREQKELESHTIIALCIDANERKILWQNEIIGTVKSKYFYGFSDSTSPSPITDGKNVWFYNASGKIVCYDMSGKQIWERAWNPVEELDEVHFPFNKQLEPMLHGDIVINMEPYWAKDGKRKFGWNYLYGLDKNTGDVKWISEDGLTHYSTPTYNTTASGVPAILVGRGAHHKVPESPKGYSLIDLNTGASIWQYETDEGMAMYNAIWTEEYALWFTERENSIHKIDAQTGQFIEKIAINKGVTYSTFDTINHRYNVAKNHSFADSNFVFPAWYTNIIVDDKCYFMCFKKTDKYRLKNAVADYTFARIDLKTKEVEYLEVPVQYKLSNEERQLIWHQNLKTETKNLRDLDLAADKRSQSDGWVWNFNPNPILINNKLFYTTMSGIVYCFDTSKKHFDETALVGISDLGALGKTWTLNTPSFSEGKLYHRTSKELICIGKEVQE